MSHPLFSFALRASIAAAAFALTLSACSSKKEDAPPAASAPTASAPAATAPVAVASIASAAAPGAIASPSAPAPDQSSQAESNPQRKLNLYIECYNHANSSFQRSLARYASWVKDMTVGPTGHERIVYGLYSVDGAQACQQAVQQAKELPPAMPQLDQAAAAFAASLEPLQATITDAYAYYDRENYKDDGFAKGKALHKTLAGQAKTFEAASRQFSDALDDADDAQQQAQLQRLEKEDGRNVAYYHLSTMIQAKGLMRMLLRDNVDIAKAGASIDAFEQTIDAMNKAPGEKPSAWWSYQSDVDNFRKTAKSLYRRRRDKTPYPMGQESLLGTSGGWMVEGSPDRLLRDYNTMVETSNNLR
jgi:hypothetical protein